MLKCLRVFPGSELVFEHELNLSSPAAEPRKYLEHLCGCPLFGPLGALIYETDIIFCAISDLPTLAILNITEGLYLAIASPAVILSFDTFNYVHAKGKPDFIPYLRDVALSVEAVQESTCFHDHPERMLTRVFPISSEDGLMIAERAPDRTFVDELREIFGAENVIVL